jgi:putative FmdB family regulatory protein
MPLYEYECDANGHRFEVIRKFSDPPVESCPQCGSAVHKRLSSPAIQFKGTGFYITDYVKKGSTAEQSGSTEGKASTEPAKADPAGKAAGSTGTTSASDSATTKSETAAPKAEKSGV